jgi:glycosyltransferase involved in cell wall biosynthesis
VAAALGDIVNKPAVLHVISGLGVGGAEASLVQVATAMQARGVPQHVVCVGSLQNYADELCSRGVAVTVLGVAGSARLPGAVLRVARIIRTNRPAVVHGWMYHGNILATLAHLAAGRRGERQLYWNLRASNMDAARYRGIVRASAMLSRVPNLIIANSRSGKEFHLSQGFRPRRIEVIANGIDTNNFRPDPQLRAARRAELGIAADAIVAIHAARVDPMKDHPVLLAAMAAVPHLRGLIVGAGTEFLRVPENVCTLGLRRDLASLYATADIVVSSSAFGEGFSNVIAEGMSVGLIPVATDVGDARDIIGDTGHVVAPGDAAALAGALAAAAGGSAMERQQGGLRARARVVEKFPLLKTIESYGRLYSSGCATTPDPARARVSAT